MSTTHLPSVLAGAPVQRAQHELLEIGQFPQRFLEPAISMVGLRRHIQAGQLAEVQPRLLALTPYHASEQGDGGLGAAYVRGNDWLPGPVLAHQAVVGRAGGQVQHARL